MPNIKIEIEFNGAGFFGWQKQPNLRTIQGELHKALEVFLRSKIRSVTASGRTDNGVHARRQTCSFKTEVLPDLNRMILGVSSLLKHEVSLLSAEVVEDNFNARKSPHYKQYSYKILNRPSYPTIDKGYVWHVPQKLNIELMKEQAALMIGEHDFKCFQAVDCSSQNTVKKILESEIIVDGNYVYYRVVGNAFLKQMVRNIIGTLVFFGLGKSKTSGMKELIEAKNRCLAGPTAPAEGLYLDWVKYL